ncbi:MAG: PHP domain-containing protein [Deltaproteobacteria bacterium]|nr:PHP domain-containing protein [Deltaproteobacteria bacterium]
MASRDGGVDLHIHSTASDGSLSPREILAQAASLGLCAVSITDHDTVDGVRDALAHGIPEPLAFATGVEISTVPPEPFNQDLTIHLLGYLFDADDPGLDEELRVLKDARANRNPRIIQKLNELGLPISMEEVAEVAGDGQVGRPHMARVLVDKGLAPDTNAVFDRWLAKGRPAYVDKYRLSVQRAVEVIRAAGGVAVLAHPSSLNMDDSTLASFVEALKDMGLAGLEAYYTGHTPAMVKKYRKLARRLSLVVTGGSDFHGASKPAVSMGSGTGDLFVPFSVYEELVAAKP